PEFFAKIEQHLPMKNDTLTFSFLVAKKRLGNLQKSADHTSQVGRIVGEAMMEKGKIRQPFCRNSHWEQLSWLKRGGSVDLPESGNLFELPDNVRVLGQELRMP